MPAHAARKASAVKVHSHAESRRPIRLFRPEYDEEERKQQGCGDRLDLRLELARQETARRRRTKHESAEHRVDADEIGEPCASREQRKHGREHPGGQASTILSGCLEPDEHGTDGPEHSSDIEHRAGGRDDGQRAMPGEASEHNRQDHPRGRIVQRACRQRERAHGGPRDAPLVDDPREDRKRRDRQRGANEQDRVERLDFGCEESAAPHQKDGQCATESKRRGDAGDRDRRGPPGMANHQLGTELQADAEHVEHDADLADDEQGVTRRGREHLRLQARCDPTEKRRAHEESRDHLCHDLRLADPGREIADRPAHEEYDGNLREER